MAVIRNMTPLHFTLVSWVSFFLLFWGLFCLFLQYLVAKDAKILWRKLSHRIQKKKTKWIIKTFVLVVNNRE